MSGLLASLKVDDIPSEAVKPIKTVGIIGEIETKEIANGYIQVTVPLRYVNNSGNESTFYGRFNLRPEWLTAEFADRAKRGELDGAEGIQYQINVQRLLKGLFSNAGVEGEMDFSVLTGRAVGFNTKNRRDDPSRLELSYFFKPKN